MKHLILLTLLTALPVLSFAAQTTYYDPQPHRTAQRGYRVDQNYQYESDYRGYHGWGNSYHYNEYGIPLFYVGAPSHNVTPEQCKLPDTSYPGCPSCNYVYFE